ncbi:TetR/AcrR family transcriptional regulator [Microlunatus lacustris]
MTSTTPARPPVTGDRRLAMAEAAITIIARDGLRALTHRAVDRELDLPAGSTSYYLRTRRLLVEAVVRRLAERTTSDVSAAPAPAAAARPPSVEELSQALAALLDRLALRRDDHLVRWALAVDLTDDPELHAFLTSASPVRASLLTRAQALLEQLDVPDAAGQARGLVALVDGLLFDRLAGSSASGPPTDAAAVLHAYLSGLPRASTG